MHVIVPRPSPGRTGWILAAINTPLDVGVLAEDAGRHEGADVEADAVVEVGVPADRLLGERLPADEDVVGRLARRG